ncbi:MAG: hypothetical protein Q9168_006981 [Polycauliona sp. 1 TL-2023]
MDDHNYELPQGLHAIPTHLLDLRPDPEIDHDLLHPAPISENNGKNMWFFWHSGFDSMHGYTRRNVRAWHRRFSKLGWVIRVLNLVPSSPLHISNFLDTTDPATFPRAFIEGTIAGEYALQHTSDLVRFPLLLRYGGVYADVGLLQIGDLDRLWMETVGNTASGVEVVAYNMGPMADHSLVNYFFACRANNPLFYRCHRLLLALWAGKQTTEGMHANPLLKGVAVLKSGPMRDGDRVFGVEESGQMMTDYVIQSQVITMVMGLVDEADGWDGPRYVADHVYALDFMNDAFLVDVLTAWAARKAFHLLSLPLPGKGMEESEEQRQAREVVTACLQRSFGFKLAHGFVLRIVGETLGSLWRGHDGSDCVPGTYADWLRYGMVYWTQNDLPARVAFGKVEPIKRGPLLRAE